MIIRDFQAAIDHSELAKFYSAVQKSTAEDIISFAELESPDLFKYWPSMFIIRHEPEQDEFRFLFHGSEMVMIYGGDVTGLTLTDLNVGDNYDILAGIYKNSIYDNETVYYGGNLDWQHRDYKRWYALSLPLQRSGQVNEVLLFVQFE